MGKQPNQYCGLLNEQVAALIMLNVSFQYMHVGLLSRKSFTLFLLQFLKSQFNKQLYTNRLTGKNESEKNIYEAQQKKTKNTHYL